MEAELMLKINFTGEEVSLFKETLEMLLLGGIKEGDRLYRTTDMGYLKGKLPERNIEQLKQIFDSIS